MSKVHFYIFIVMAVSINGNIAAYLKLTNAVCESHNQSWVTIDHCRLRAIQRDKTVFNANLTIYYPATKIDLKFKVVKKASGYKPFLIDFKIDACAFLRKYNHPFAKMVFNWVKNYTTITHTCPYMGPQGIQNFYLKAEHIPLPIPTGDYGLLLTWHFSDIPQFSINVFFTFVDLLNQ